MLNVPGIPTLYRGVQYRSRLEARWAAFFDLMGWTYQYEPMDLEGWIPDFALTGKGWPVLVEVKPVFEFPQETADKIDRTSYTGDVLIVGCELKEISESLTLRIGWLRGAWAPDDPPNRQWWEEAVFGTWTKMDPDPRDHNLTVYSVVSGFTSHVGSWVNRIGYGFGPYYSNDDALNQMVRDYWNRAGNLTQWKGKQSITE